MRALLVLFLTAIAQAAGPIGMTYLNGTQISTPSNPAASHNKLYFKSDNNLYSLTSSGTETQIGLLTGTGANNQLTLWSGTNTVTGNGVFTWGTSDSDAIGTTGDFLHNLATSGKAAIFDAQGNGAFQDAGMNVGDGGSANRWSVRYGAFSHNFVIKFFGGAANTDFISITTGGVVAFNKGHLQTTGTAPTPTPTANLGTSATCTVVHATDTAGTITLVSGSASLSSGDQCDMAFVSSYSTAPICMLSAANATAAQDLVSVGEYVTSSTTQMSVNFAVASAAAQTYAYNYWCSETQ